MLVALIAKIEKKMAGMLHTPANYAKVLAQLSVSELDTILVGVPENPTLVDDGLLTAIEVLTPLWEKGGVWSTF